jgi:hypothetical protein
MRAKEITQVIEILLVEDSPTDVLMVREPITHTKVLHHLHVFEYDVVSHH